MSEVSIPATIKIQVNYWFTDYLNKSKSLRKKVLSEAKCRPRKENYLRQEYPK